MNFNIISIAKFIINIDVFIVINVKNYNKNICKKFSIDVNENVDKKFSLIKNASDYNNNEKLSQNKLKKFLQNRFDEQSDDFIYILIFKMFIQFVFKKKKYITFAITNIRF